MECSKIAEDFRIPTTRGNVIVGDDFLASEKINMLVDVIAWKITTVLVVGVGQGCTAGSHVKIFRRKDGESSGAF